MRLTARAEYALLAMIFLARKPDKNSRATVATIAAAQNIPERFLEQILLTLKGAHYVTSTKGQHGGFALAKSPKQINLAEIIRLFDGALAPTGSVSVNFYASTPIEKETKVLKLFRKIRNEIAQQLESTSLFDVT